MPKTTTLAGDLPPSDSADDLEQPAPRDRLGDVVIFRLGGEDMPAIVTRDHGDGVLSLTCLPWGQPQMVRNHVTRARHPFQENVWRERT